MSIPEYKGWGAFCSDFTVKSTPILSRVNLPIASQSGHMLQFPPPDKANPLGHGAMVAQRTLDPLILVRIRMPQLDGQSGGMF